MGTFTAIPTTAFSELQMDAGVILTSFTPSTPAIASNAQVCATTGGINISCTPTYSDLGEDVDNCPNNTKEFKHLDGWDVKMTTTALGTSPAMIKLALGAADIDGTDSTKITPRKNLATGDFTSSLWWVGDRADGGFVAVEIKNALSTGGFTLQTTKNGKGQITLEITGHVSISAQTTMPIVVYSAAGSSSGTNGATT